MAVNHYRNAFLKGTVPYGIKSIYQKVCFILFCFLMYSAVFTLSNFRYLIYMSKLESNLLLRIQIS